MNKKVKASDVILFREVKRMCRKTYYNFILFEKSNRLFTIPTKFVFNRLCLITIESERKTI